MEKKCLVHSCEEIATWSFGEVARETLVYCDRHVLWGQYVVINLAESLREDRQRGSSLTGHKDQPGPEDLGQLMLWIGAYWRKYQWQVKTGQTKSVMSAEQRSEDESFFMTSSAEKISPKGFMSTKTVIQKD